MKRRSFVLLASLLALNALAREPVRARHAMVTAQEPLAADAGIATLQAGGNAVDAAIATGFALAVTFPYAGNIGGGGFMLVRMAGGRTAFIDFRETAPLAATHDMYLDSTGKPTRDSILGYRAGGVPGTVRGFEYAHRKFGRARWDALVDPAVRLARDGVPVSWRMARSLEKSRQRLEQFPESKRIFLNGGAMFQAGDRLMQPDLAATLGRIRDRGAAGFYEGETAQRIADAMHRNGGLITLEDLKRYQAVERKPLAGRYKGYDVLTSPPPSAGGIGILQMLGMLEGSDYEKTGAGSAATYHYLAECMRRAYADRGVWLGDPDFFDVPTQALLSPRYLGWRRSGIQPGHASSSDGLAPETADLHWFESGQTTHYNVVDAEGNAVAVTYTLNGAYGSGVTVPGAGFLLNDEMDDFAAKPGVGNMFGLVQGEANAIQPGKRPLSSMTPTILTRDGRLFMVLGAPGGAHIVSNVLQAMVNVLDFGMNVQDAIDWPRVHHQWRPDKLEVEPGVSPDTVRLLKQYGHTVDPHGDSALVDAIVVSDGWRQGAVDGRGADSKATGY
ncbi:MAG: gamma-glutamyltransferase [Bryobacteraceae bacterium]|jgi:gamma-glutamyltranspeptidase/glutathione hydrolase